MSTVMKKFANNKKQDSIQLTLMRFRNTRRKMLFQFHLYFIKFYQGKMLHNK